MSAIELTLVTGEHLRVNGEPAPVEKAILSAARGSLLEFVWLEEVGSGRALGINPAHVVSLRAADD